MDENSSGGNLAACEEGDNNIAEPIEGVEFDSEEAAKIYYDNYARNVGFVMRVMPCRRSERDGKIIARRLGCNKEGYRVNRMDKSNQLRKPKPITREGCRAMINLKFRSGIMCGRNISMCAMIQKALIWGVSNTLPENEVATASKILANLIVMGGGILARAMVQAYRQALSNASKSGVAQETMNTVRRASKTMTEQEARQILGVSEETPWEDILKKYDGLFERNAKNGSFYLQSKVHRAKECLEEVTRGKGESAPS